MLKQWFTISAVRADDGEVLVSGVFPGLHRSALTESVGSHGRITRFIAANDADEAALAFLADEFDEDQHHDENHAS